VVVDQAAAAVLSGRSQSFDAANSEVVGHILWKPQFGPEHTASNLYCKCVQPLGKSKGGEQ